MKSVVLLSGGMDSTVNLYEAQENGPVALALTIHYGQRAAQKEILAAAQICQKLGIQHRILELPFFRDFNSSSLIDTKKLLPLQAQVSMDDLNVSQQTAKSVWVPNRNGILLNIAAGFAETLGADTVVPGFNKEEATTFPDNSRAFMKEVTKSLSYSTANQVRVACFTVDMDKTQIVRRGNQLKVDWSLIWPCYQSFDRWCGQCESCQRAKRAFKANGVTDENFMG